MKKHRQVKKDEILGTIVADKKGNLHWGDKDLKIAAKGDAGEGETGPKGDIPKHEWDGTKIRFENPDGTWGPSVDIRGNPGEKVEGDPGPKPVKGEDYQDGIDGKDALPPKHEWSGTKIRFQNPDGSWGRWVELKGKDGYTPKKGVDYSDGKTPVKGKDYRDGKDGKTPKKGVDYDDGKDGITPKKGEDYFDGEDGYTPQKGKDYRDGEPGKNIKGDPGIAPNDLAILVEDVQKLQKQVAGLLNDNS